VGCNFRFGGRSHELVSQGHRDPILHEGAQVTLDAGGDTALLPCRIVGLTGDELALLPLRPPEPATWRQLAMRRPCMVLFESGGQVRALRGNAAGVRSGGFLAVALTDDFRLGQKRRHSRAPLSFSVALADPVEGEAWSSVSLDISAAGVRVERPDVDDPARGGSLTIAVPDGEVTAQAVLVKAAPEWLSYRFGAIDADGTRRLAALVLAYNRRQFAAKPGA
jgi:PilZ domain-containing protein